MLDGESIRIAERSFFVTAFGIEALLDVLLTPLRDASGNVEGGLVIVHDITRYKRAEEALRASEERLREAQRLAHVGSWEWDLHRDEIRCSEEMFRIAGRLATPRAIDLEHLLEWLHEHEREQWHAALRQAISACAGFVREARVVRPTGSVRVVEARVEAVGGAEGTVSLRGTWLDITERKHAAETRERERQFRTLAENSTDIIVRFNRDLHPVYVNPAIDTILGPQRDETYPPSEGGIALPEALSSAMAQEVKKVVSTGEARAFMTTLPTPHGERYLDSRVVPEFGPDGDVESVLVVDRDVTELKRAEQELEQLTMLDPLTGIPNRRHLDQIVEQEWRREARHRHQVAIIMIDIDHFKAFNDHYGHPRGDECLRQVAQLLRRMLHRPADTVARYGGEEFVVFLPETNSTGGREIAERLRQGVVDLGIPHAYSPVADRVTVSLGAAAIWAQEGKFHDLLAAADAALYRAKEQGRNRVAMG